MNQIYFEANGEELLSRIGMTKSEFARQMGIRKQNVKALFRTKNRETIYKVAAERWIQSIGASKTKAILS